MRLKIYSIFCCLFVYCHCMFLPNLFWWVMSCNHGYCYNPYRQS